MASNKVLTLDNVKSFPAKIRAWIEKFIKADANKVIVYTNNTASTEAVYLSDNEATIQNSSEGLWLKLKNSISELKAGNVYLKLYKLLDRVIISKTKNQIQFDEDGRIVNTLNGTATANTTEGGLVLGVDPTSIGVNDNRDKVPYGIYAGHSTPLGHTLRTKQLPVLLGDSVTPTGAAHWNVSWGTWLITVSMSPTSSTGLVSGKRFGLYITDRWGESSSAITEDHKFGRAIGYTGDGITSVNSSAVIKVPYGETATIGMEWWQNMGKAFNFDMTADLTRIG